MARAHLRRPRHRRAPPSDLPPCKHGPLYFPVLEAHVIAELSDAGNTEKLERIVSLFLGDVIEIADDARVAFSVIRSEAAAASTVAEMWHDVHDKIDIYEAGGDPDGD